MMPLVRLQRLEILSDQQPFGDPWPRLTMVNGDSCWFMLVSGGKLWLVTLNDSRQLWFIMENDGKCLSNFLEPGFETQTDMRGHAPTGFSSMNHSRFDEKNLGRVGQSLGSKSRKSMSNNRRGCPRQHFCWCVRLAIGTSSTGGTIVLGTGQMVHQ